ncbi:unnamed protein product [Calicophoron daubneyi]|uniref:Calponin-homology (CH) domain-containing protein n=1 Tax=Calicophoron daubneyi TaxID=300641 RepID=A0AAV2TPR0_CALDB
MLHGHIADVHAGEQVDKSLDEIARQNLLSWCRTVTTGYPGVFIRDFTDSWRDGRAFLAIIHRYKPNLVDFHTIDGQTVIQNLELAFSVAERELQVARLFDPEDVAAITDERPVMMYVACLYEALVSETPSLPPLPPLYRTSTDVVMRSSSALVGVEPSEANNAVNIRWTEYRTLATSLIQWLRSSADRMASRHFPPDLESMQQRVLGDIRRHRREERPRRERERQQLVRLFEELKPSIQSGQLPNDPFLAIEQINRLWSEYDLALQERELAARSELHRLDRLHWNGNRTSRECKTVDAQLTALEMHIREAGKSGLDGTEQLNRIREQLGTIESKLNNLFTQVQHLRSGRYTQTDQIYRDVCLLHQRFLDLQRHFRTQMNSTALNPTHSMTSYTPTHVQGATSISTIFPQSFPRVDQRYEFLTPIQRCLMWITERKNLIENTSCGSTPKSVEEATRRQEQIHREILNYRTEIERCRTYQNKLARRPKDLQVFNESMTTLEQEYQHLSDASSKRNEALHSLVEFVRRAELELAWLREHESCEVNREWYKSEQQLDVNSVRIYFQNLMQQLSQREISYNELSVLGSSMQLENHPAAELVQAYIVALDRHWAWLLQLTRCLESHLEQLTRNQEFETEALKCEGALKSLLDELRTQFGPGRVPKTIQECNQMKSQLKDILNQLMELDSAVLHVIDLSQQVLPPLSAPSTPADSSAPEQQYVGRQVRAICSFNSDEYWLDAGRPEAFSAAPNPIVGTTFWPAGDHSGSFEKGDPLVVVMAFESKVWKVRTPNGASMWTPTVCFLSSGFCKGTLERGRSLAEFLAHVKSCWSAVDLHLTSHLFRMKINEWQRSRSSSSANSEEQALLAEDLLSDGLSHLMALRLGNLPKKEVDAFHNDLLTFQREVLKQPNGPADEISRDQDMNASLVAQKLSHVLDTLAARLQQSVAGPLPGKLTELEHHIQEHKEWVDDLTRARSQCAALNKHLADSQIGHQPDSAAVTSLTRGLCDAAVHLQSAGQLRAQLLADTDVWLVRLDETDQTLADCELALLGSAVHNHALLPVDSGLEIPRPDGLRSNAVDRARKDLETVAKRLPGLRTQLDTLAQQMPSCTPADSVSVADSLSRDPSVAGLLTNPDTHMLESNLAFSYRRLGCATKEVEEELNGFDESLTHFGHYQQLYDQITIQMTDFAKRLVSLGELARSVGLESITTDTNLAKVALVQADEFIAEVQRHSEHVEALNHQVAQLVLVLMRSRALAVSETDHALVSVTWKSQKARRYNIKLSMNDRSGENYCREAKLGRDQNVPFKATSGGYPTQRYAELTQSYRQLVETVFQKSGGLRDYRWSPGFGLFDLQRILQNVEQVNETYEHQSRYVHEQVNILYKIIKSSGYDGSMTLAIPPKPRDYRQLYPGEWPTELVNSARSDSSTSSPINGELIFAPKLLSPLSGAPQMNGNHRQSEDWTSSTSSWEVFLGCVENEPVVQLPVGSETVSSVSRKQISSSALRAPLPTSGAWFVTRLNGRQDADAIGEPMCIGDAIRCGLIDPHTQSCRQNSTDPSVSWSTAVERGWISEQAVRVLNSKVSLGSHGTQTIADCLFQSGLRSYEGIDPNTGRVLPNNERLIELLAEGKLSQADFHRLAGVLASGICVEYRDTRISWQDATASTSRTGQSDVFRPCLSDWLAAGCYNPVTRRLRLSILKPESTEIRGKPSRRLFSEDELTIREAIQADLLDDSVPEIVVPMETSTAQTSRIPYRRITLEMAISLGLIDAAKGMWCGISQFTGSPMGLEVAQAAGLITRAPNLAELLLSGLLTVDENTGNGQPKMGVLDAHTGAHLSFREAVQRGLLVGDKLALMILKDFKFVPLTVNEALSRGILNENGEIMVFDEDRRLSIWDAVNCGYIRLVWSTALPPLAGIMSSPTAKLYNQRYHQHPVLQALRTGLLDATTEEVILSEAEARQYGLTYEQRRVPLRRAPKLANLCDATTVRLLTRPSGLSYPDGRELTGLEALARGWLKPSGDSPAELNSYGKLIDPATGTTMEVNTCTAWPSSRPLSTDGVELLLGCSSNRPYLGYLLVRRTISRLLWLGPGLYDDALMARILRIPQSASVSGISHRLKSDSIVAVIDPISGRRLGVTEAVRRHLLDLEAGTFHNSATGQVIPMSQAVHEGLVVTEDDTSKTSGKPDERVFSMKETRTFRITEVTDPLTGRKLSPDEAVAKGLLNPRTMMFEGVAPGIPIDEARKRGLVTVTENVPPTVLHGSTPATNRPSNGSVSSVKSVELSFEEAISRGFIDPGTSMFCRPGSSSPISVQEAIELGWVSPPKSKEIPNQSGRSTMGHGQKRPGSPSSLPPRKRGARTPLTASIRNFLRSQSPLKLFRSSSAMMVTSGTDRGETFATGGRTETTKRAIRTLDGSGPPIRIKPSTPLLSRILPRSHPTPTESNGLKPPQPPQFTTECRERDCVLYAFYYLHDDVRVETAISESMVQEGLVDTRQALICNPVTGVPTPVAEALTSGFVFGMVFTQAESIISPESAEGLKTGGRNKMTFWLEVFHHRHDIYQLERVFDPYVNKLVSIQDALTSGLIDPVHCTYTHPVTGEVYSLEDAVYRGWIQALPMANPPPFDLVGGRFDSIHIRTVEEGLTFTSVRRGGQLVSSPTSKRGTLSRGDQTDALTETGERTTLSVKRHLPGQPTPQFNPSGRQYRSSVPYHLKPGYRLTPEKKVQDIKTGECVSLAEAFLKHYASPLVGPSQADAVLVVQAIKGGLNTQNKMSQYNGNGPSGD